LDAADTAATTGETGALNGARPKRHERCFAGQHYVMTLVSSPSLLLKKRVTAVTVTLLVNLISISCFGQPAFFPVSSTPYDRQMIRVNPVLTSANTQRPGPISSSFVVNQWMAELRAIP
jgi:hypothetical protein